MKIFRVSIHSLVITVVNLLSIGIGAVTAIWFTGETNHASILLPISIILSVGCTFLWFKIVNILGLNKLRPVEYKELLLYILFSIILNPLLFVPIHFITQGYFTGAGNLIALAIYQLIVNSFSALILGLSLRLMKY